MNDNYEHEYEKGNFGSVMTGLVVGGLAGAAVMILLAPQSGRQTRMQIQEKSIELRDKTSAMLGDAIEQVRTDGQKLASDSSMKAKELLHQGQTLVADQLGNVSDAVLAAREKTIAAIPAVDSRMS